MNLLNILADIRGGRIDPDIGSTSADWYFASILEVQYVSHWIAWNAYIWKIYTSNIKNIMILCVDCQVYFIYCL